MAEGLSNYLKEALLKHALGQDTYTPPANIYMALYTNDVDEDGVGTEVTGGSYAPQIVTFDAVVDGQAVNDAMVEFTDMPAVTVQSACLWDGPNPGSANPLWVAPLVEDVNITATSAFAAHIGNIKVQIA